MPRLILKQARVSAKMTQQQVAKKLGIATRYYQNIEEGSRNGNFKIWDSLEDIFNIHQRELRQLSQEDNLTER